MSAHIVCRCRLTDWSNSPKRFQADVFQCLMNFDFTPTCSAVVRNWVRGVTCSSQCLKNMKATFWLESCFFSLRGSGDCCHKCWAIFKWEGKNKNWRWNGIKLNLCHYPSIHFHHFIKCVNLFKWHFIHNTAMTVSYCIDHSPLSKVRGKFYHSGAMLEIPPGVQCQDISHILFNINQSATKTWPSCPLLTIKD